MFNTIRDENHIFWRDREIVQDPNDLVEIDGCHGFIVFAHIHTHTGAEVVFIFPVNVFMKLLENTFAHIEGQDPATSSTYLRSSLLRRTADTIPTRIWKKSEGLMEKKFCANTVSS